MKEWEKRLLDVVENGSAVIGVVGLGYVGLPVALSFARKYRVIGYDIDEAKIEKLRRGETYISYISSEEIRGASNLYPTSDASDLGETDFIIITVPTPLKANRVPDLSYVRAAGETVGSLLRVGQFVVLESTSFPGTTEEVLVPILEKKSGLRAVRDFGVAYSPERIDPGNKRYRFENTPKVVGGLTPLHTEIAARLYSKVVERVVKVSDARTAEAVKMLENIFRNVNIALVNELAVIFEKMGIDIWEVIEAAKTKPFGFMAFYPGPGVGGHCIPVDPFYMSYKAKHYDLIPRFIELAGEVNEYMPIHVANLVAKGLQQRGKKLWGARVAVLGLAYKRDVDDARESPSLKIIEELVERGAEVRVHDPFIERVVVGGREYRSEPVLDELVEWAEALVVAVDHTYYRERLPRIAVEGLLRGKVVVDTRNVVPKSLGKGFTLIRLGDGRSVEEQDTGD